jgi:hypothetical protein
VTTWCIGFDLSLRAPAAVALPLDWRPGDWKRVKAWLGVPPEPESKDDYKGQMARYRWIADWADKCVRGLGKVRVHGAVESYGFSKNNSYASHIMGSGEIVKLVLWERHGLALQPFTSSACRKLLLGFNPRRPQHDPKLEVQRALFAAKAPKTWDENVCDAFCCCNYALSELGGKILNIMPVEKPTKKRARK